jgi:hypothetical protein
MKMPKVPQPGMSTGDKPGGFDPDDKPGGGKPDADTPNGRADKGSGDKANGGNKW